jgi:DNA-binding LacI/PurR family transcriptional regulator
LVTTSCDAPLYLPDWLKRHKAGLPWVDLSGFGTVPHRIRSDNDALARIGLDFLLGQGRNRIGAVVTAPVYREALVEQARLREILMEPEWLVSMERMTNGIEDVGFRLMKQIWACPRKPNALFVFDDIAAKGVVQAILQLGIRVPDELLIVTLANKDSGVFYPIPMQRVEYDLEELARLGGGLLLDLLRDPDLAPCERVFRPAFGGTPASHQTSRGRLDSERACAAQHEGSEE